MNTKDRVQVYQKAIYTLEKSTNLWKTITFQNIYERRITSCGLCYLFNMLGYKFKKFDETINYQKEKNHSEFAFWFPKGNRKVRIKLLKRFIKEAN